MRLNRLDLIRYGRFTDASIAFDKPAAGMPDVTVIFGENEAGKSTTFNGLLELLFGFKAGAHPYAFRYERSDLLVGAELELPGRGTSIFRRNSKRTQSLLDAQDRPLDEAILSSALHGLSRDTYEERFSLNERGLREGGARIAGAQGDLGQLLHAGLSGLTGIADTLDALTARADRFHKKGGRGTVLKSGKDRLKEISQSLRTEILTVERERNLRRDRDRATAAFEAADDDLHQAHKRQAASKAAEVWYEQTALIVRLTEALAQFPEGPDLAADTAEQVAGLVEKIKALTRRIGEATEDIDRLDTAIAENPADPQAEDLAAEVQRLDQLTIDGAPLMGRASTAQADLTRRQQEHVDLSQQMEKELHHLGLSETHLTSVALNAEDLEALTDAVQKCLTTTNAANTARTGAAAARAQQGEAPKEPQDLTALRVAFDGWKTVANASAAEASQSQARDRLTKSAAGLPSSWTALIGSGLPAPETLEEVARRWSDIHAGLGSARDDLEAASEKLAEARADLQAEVASADAVDVVKTEETRRRRDVVWSQHRAQLTDETANFFEAAMHQDDAARARFLSGASARERLLSLQKQERAAGARLETAQKKHDALVEQKNQLSERCGTLALALGLAEDTPASAFGTRRQALSMAAEAAAELSNSERALAERRAAQEAALKTLADTAGPFGVDAAQSDLPAEVQRALTLEESDRKVWAKWQEGQKTIAELDSEAERTQTDFEIAQHALDQLAAPLPLPDRSFTAIQKVLPHLRNLQQLHGERRKLSERIEALERAIAALKEGAARLARIMGSTDQNVGIDPVQIIDQARARAAQASRKDEKREEALSRKAETEKQQRHSEIDLQDAQDALDRCFENQAESDLPPRERVATLVERDRLRAEMAAADHERRRMREGVDADLSEEELDLMPDATREKQLELAQTDAQTARDTALDAQRQAERAYTEAFERTTHSDLVTEKATLLEELRAGARQAAIARLGELAARGALRRLAAERRSGMLRDVEEAFVAMTAPAWTGVDVWTQNEGDKLVGIQPNGNPVPVEQMSTGTMGQLYFALRLAGYRSFARDPGPLPMVLDDIMEAFDDTRARAALRLCAEIGMTGQAILFTHHAHLVALARECIEGVNVVNMPD